VLHESSGLTPHKTTWQNTTSIANGCAVDRLTASQLNSDAIPPSVKAVWHGNEALWAQIRKQESGFADCVQRE
jgi:hypothetical protein